jgi:nucleotide-binding universal stress UspA family protein
LWNFGAVRTVCGTTARQIVATAKAHHANLIVLGVHGLDTLAGIRTRLQDDITYEVIAEAPCPVLAVRSQNTAMDLRRGESSE